MVTAFGDAARLTWASLVDFVVAHATPSPAPCALAYTTPADECAYVLRTPACQPDGLIPFLQWAYCAPAGATRGALLASFVLVALILFHLLATTAQRFLCPCLEELAERLNMSPAIAGVTFLALGNGAPDVFAAISAVRGGAYSLALGSLTGAGLFVGSVVVGAVVYVSKGVTALASLVRDAGALLGAVAAVLVIVYVGTVTVWVPVFLLAYYALYIILLLVVDMWPTQRRLRALASFYVVGEPTSHAYMDIIDEYIEEEEDGEEEDADSDVEDGPTKHGHEHGHGHWFKRTVAALEWPFSVGRHLCIPQQTSSEHWCLWKACVAVGLCPILCWLNIPPNPGSLPVWVHVMITAASAMLGTGVYVVESMWPGPSPPRFRLVYPWVGFVSGVMWIHAFAAELVTVVKVLGIAWHIEDAVMGMTLLAWGNSLPDLITNTTLAKRGHSRMAMAACYASPLFNLTVGLGLGLVAGFARQRVGRFELHVVLAIVMVSAITTLAATLLCSAINNGHLPQAFGVFLLVLYLVALLAVCTWLLVLLPRIAPKESMGVG